MTSVAMGCLVHTADKEYNHILKRVETLCSGDLVHTPHDVARVRGVVLMWCPDAVYPLCHVGGLRAASTQDVFFGGVWCSTEMHSSPVVQACRGVVGILLQDADAVLIDGVACKTFPPSPHLRSVRLRCGSNTCVIRGS